MYCKKCGKEINDDAAVCVYCGRAVEKESAKDHSQPKTGIGVLMGLFLGVIGLIIGICMYPEGTVARSSFVKSWCITFFVSWGIAILMYLIVIGAALGAVR